jgi:hypothetical protein
MYTIFFISFLKTLALHVSGAICSLHQEHNCSVGLVSVKTEVLVSSGVEVYEYFV